MNYNTCIFIWFLFCFVLCFASFFFFFFFFFSFLLKHLKLFHFHDLLNDFYIYIIGYNTCKMSGPIPPPKISDGYLGKQAKFDEFGLSTITHPEPAIELNTNEIEIHIGYSQPTRFTTKLLLCGAGGKDNPESVMVNNLQGRMCYTITVPQVGYYKFQIYALPLTEAGPNMVGVFNYLLLVKDVDEEIRPYPKQYPPWKNGCYMWEPRGIPRGCRAPGVPFKMHIPNAIQVRGEFNAFYCCC